MILPRGVIHLSAQADQYSIFRTDQDEGDHTLDIRLARNETVTVHAEADVSLSRSIGLRLHAGRSAGGNSGASRYPLSVPKFPKETASGGIKAPQYFAPDVTGDHGEPIDQFFQIGDFLFQNNLTANAHGNGYADPNIIKHDRAASVST